MFGGLIVIDLIVLLLHCTHEKQQSMDENPTPGVIIMQVGSADNATGTGALQPLNMAGWQNL